MNFQIEKALKVVAVLVAILIAAFALGFVNGVDVKEVREEVKL